MRAALRRYYARFTRECHAERVTLPRERAATRVAAQRVVDVDAFHATAPMLTLAADDDAATLCRRSRHFAFISL